MKRIDFAIKMENEGAHFYDAQAVVYKDTPLAVIFEKLARAERRHAELLRNHASGDSYTLFDDPLLDESKSLFNSLESYHHEFIAQPGQLEAYRFALDIEKRSVELYQDMLIGAATPADRELLSWLIRQEKEHLALFDELETMLNRPVEWVENAEFGVREEY